MSLDRVEEARKKFMRGEMSASEYWDIRVSYYSDLMSSNERKKKKE